MEVAHSERNAAIVPCNMGRTTKKYKNVLSLHLQCIVITFTNVLSLHLQWVGTIPRLKEPYTQYLDKAVAMQLTP